MQGPSQLLHRLAAARGCPYRRCAGLTAPAKHTRLTAHSSAHTTPGMAAAHTQQPTLSNPARTAMQRQLQHCNCCMRRRMHSNTAQYTPREIDTAQATAAPGSVQRQGTITARSSQQQGLALLVASSLAPLSSSSRAAALWPLTHAAYSGVLPFCRPGKDKGAQSVQGPSQLLHRLAAARGWLYRRCAGQQQAAHIAFTAPAKHTRLTTHSCAHTTLVPPTRNNQHYLTRPG